MPKAEEEKAGQPQPGPVSRATCPHCGKPLTQLKFHRDRHAWEDGTARIIRDEFDLVDEREDGAGEIDFTCPYCGGDICGDEVEAESFLRTGKLEEDEAPSE
jgi:hypothetical protein